MSGGAPAGDEALPRPRIVGVGEPTRGDDGAGPAVVRWLRAHGAADRAELRSTRDPSALVDLLAHPGAVYVIDAALGPRPGEVVVFAAGKGPRRDVRPLSSHGVAVEVALALAELLHGPARAPRWVVAVCVVPPAPAAPPREGLSPATWVAVERAGRLVLDALGS